MEVLYTLTARSFSSSVPAWYTLASLPVDTQPLMVLKMPLLSILNRTMRVRGSIACSTVARSLLSTTFRRAASCFLSDWRTLLATPPVMRAVSAALSAASLGWYLPTDTFFSRPCSLLACGCSVFLFPTPPCALGRCVTRTVCELALVDPLSAPLALMSSLMSTQSSAFITPSSSSSSLHSSSSQYSSPASWAFKDPTRPSTPVNPRKSAVRASMVGGAFFAFGSGALSSLSSSESA
mmetsp:Transcript_60366/g.191754  ORF Transcript_60366/g.191754 Transcript_60366/m.191754 type:complete len:237 (-) Transcript_60366:103-813(-)